MKKGCHKHPRLIGNVSETFSETTAFADTVKASETSPAWPNTLQHRFQSFNRFLEFSPFQKRTPDFVFL